MNATPGKQQRAPKARARRRIGQQRFPKDKRQARGSSRGAVQRAASAELQDTQRVNPRQRTGEAAPKLRRPMLSDRPDGSDVRGVKCDGRASLIMHSYLERQRIATQM